MNIEQYEDKLKVELPRIKTMNKPTPKREVAVRFKLEMLRLICFYSTEDAITEFETFGTIAIDPDITNCYTLLVDARFDFGEVLAYIEGYGQL